MFSAIAHDWSVFWDGVSRRPRGFFIALILITLLGAAVRVYKLGDYPGGFGQDEAVVLYDAWCFLETGAEHHGDRWPLNAREFGDYPSALPSYYMLPLVALFGPSPVAHRMFCALLNAAAIFIAGLLMRRLFRSPAAGLFTAILLAVAPWNIFFSRWAVSAGYCTFFKVFALWLLHRLLTHEGVKRGSLLAAAGVGFALFLWTHTYLSQYFFAPFMIGAAFLLWHKHNWPRIIVAGGTYSVLMIAALWSRVVIPSAASGRLQKELVFYTDKGWTLLWENYCDYQSLEFLFQAPQMLPLQSLPGVAHISNLLWPIYLFGLGVLIAAALVPGWLLGQLGRPAVLSDRVAWRRAAIWLLLGVALAPFASAIFIAELYTARLTHLLMQVILVTAVGCTGTWYLLQRIPGRFAGIVFVSLLSLYLGSQLANTAEGLSRNNMDLKKELQQGLPDVMRYLARQPDVRSASFPPRLHQVYIYHLCFTPVHPARLNYAELTPSPAKPGERWRYDEINRVGNYYFNQNLDRNEIARTATLRHQVRDRDRIWFDLYERNGDWFVLKSP